MQFKVAYTAGGQMRLPPLPLASGRRLKGTDLLVTVHSQVTQSGRDVIAMDRPRHIAGYTSSRMGLLSLA